MEDNKPQIEEHVLASQRGDSDAFAKVYDHFVAPIYRYVHYRVGPKDAEDLTELVFLKTWENIRQYKKGKHSFSAWIFRIAHNVVIDHYRSRRSDDELTENVEDHRIESLAATRVHRRIDRELLDAAMVELKDHYRQILILKYINDLTNEEIGFVTGKSQASLRILQFRALRSLKRVLERHGVTEA